MHTTDIYKHELIYACMHTVQVCQQFCMCVCVCVCMYAYVYMCVFEQESHWITW